MTSDELKKYCDGEFENIDRIVNELFSVYSTEKTEYSLSEKASIFAFLSNIYSGFENILKQMLIFDKLDITDSPGWHEKVLKKAGEIGILPPDMFQIFSKYLAFRNYFVYAYIFNIQWDEARVLVDTIKEMKARFRTEIYEYIQTI
jgi:uncharacterized protein YutE (UPF0331/DUF86 family)